MAGVKLIVIYARPKDVAVFERVYQEEHVPLAVAKLSGKTKIVATKVVGSPQGTPPFYRIAEVHFPSLQALEASAVSEGGKQPLAYAVSISSGGAPIFLVAEEETFAFSEAARA
ncbi:MAG TPA: EthD family reductase [Terriglobia bacterium]|nr:EthD family reductase [Terriglobia bacterium]